MTHLADIDYMKTTDQLADLFDAYCTEQGWNIDAEDRPDAEELLLIVLRQREWLQAFIERWNVVQAEEDFQHACAMRGE